MIAAGAMPPASAIAAAVPAACPIAKQAPETRAADCPMCVIDAHRPATNRFEKPRGSSIRQGRWLNPREPGCCHLNSTSPAT